MTTINDYQNYKIYENDTITNINTDRTLKVNMNRNGYLQVGLRNNPKRKTFEIHRLIALYFIPNHNKLAFVDHINRIKDDNRIENLRWVSQSENSVNTDRYDRDLKNISLTNGIRITIYRNTYSYNKRCKTIEEAIIQRDKMLSMFK